MQLTGVIVTRCVEVGSRVALGRRDLCSGTFREMRFSWAQLPWRELAGSKDQSGKQWKSIRARKLITRWQGDLGTVTSPIAGICFLSCKIKVTDVRLPRRAVKAVRCARMLCPRGRGSHYSRHRFAYLF